MKDKLKETNQDILGGINLQLFADGGEESPEGDNQTGSEGQGDEGLEDKTFSQDDVNNVVAKETRKAQEKLFKELGIEDFENAREGMEKFREWQESQKTDAEKQSEKLSNLEKSYADKTSENETLKAQVNAMKVGVNSESVEDVVTLAKNLVSEDVDMDAAIKQVIEKYPHFVTETEEKKDEEGKPLFSIGEHTKKQTTDAEQWINAFK